VKTVPVLHAIVTGSAIREVRWRVAMTSRTRGTPGMSTLSVRATYRAWQQRGA
jgi:hypothetical protein